MYDGVKYGCPAKTSTTAFAASDWNFWCLNCSFTDLRPHHAWLLLPVSNVRIFPKRCLGNRIAILSTTFILAHRTSLPQKLKREAKVILGVLILFFSLFTISFRSINKCDYISHNSNSKFCFHLIQYRIIVCIALVVANSIILFK